MNCFFSFEREKREVIAIVFACMEYGNGRCED